MQNNHDWYEVEELWQDLANIAVIPPSLWCNAKKETDSILKLVGTSEFSNILDVCCGNGRHSIEFAKLGYKVTGVDRNALYLDDAKSRCNGSKISVPILPVDFIQSDIREFIKSNRYELAINMNNSFGFFQDRSDDVKVVKNIFESLVSKGKFLIQLTSKEILARKFLTKNWYQDSDKLYLVEKKITQNWSWLEQQWTVVDSSGEIRKYPVNRRIYSATELEKLLEEAGFTSVVTYGDLNGSKYDHQAKTLVLIATK